jgi:hypothetical protein
MIKTKQFRNVLLIVGRGQRFGLGLVMDKYGVNIDLGPFWIAVEF